MLLKRDIKMNAAQRLDQLDSLDANELCAKTDSKLSALVNVMNRETMLLRAGHLKEAGTLTPEKTQLSQDYVMLARAVKREAKRLKIEAPEQLNQLQARHESLATQMADNLRVLATAKTVAQDILSDVAKSVGASEKPKTYNDSGLLSSQKPQVARGLSIDRAL